MLIVADFGSDVQTYQSRFSHLTFPPLRRCPYCAGTEQLVGHGSYPRHVCDEEKTFAIRIKRFLCTACRHTVSLLPSFCLPYRHYHTSTIQTVLSLRFETGTSWKALCERFSATGLPALSTARGWIAGFGQGSEVYLRALTHQLASWQLASGKLELALADISGLAKVPCQLIAAVPHLVAWLWDKGLRIIEEGAGAGYPLGAARWLSTLWQWGHGTKLGRLV